MVSGRARAGWRLGLCACGLGLVVGCSSDDGPNCAALATEQAALVIGGTTPAFDGFVALASGDNLKVIINSKGLFVLPPSLRVAGLHPGEPGRLGDPDDPQVAIRAYVGETYVGGTDVSVVDGTPLPQAPHYGFDPIAGGGQLIAVSVVFLDGLDPRDYLNQTVSLEATTTDACGRSATGQLSVVAFWQY